MGSAQPPRSKPLGKLNRVAKPHQDNHEQKFDKGRDCHLRPRLNSQLQGATKAGSQPLRSKAIEFSVSAVKPTKTNPRHPAYHGQHLLKYVINVSPFIPHLVVFFMFRMLQIFLSFLFFFRCVLSLNHSSLVVLL